MGSPKDQGVVQHADPVAPQAGSAPGQAGGGTSFVSHDSSQQPLDFNRRQEPPIPTPELRPGHLSLSGIGSFQVVGVSSLGATGQGGEPPPNNAP